MPYTPTPLDLITPADSNHACFSKVNQNFSDIESTLTEVASLVLGGGFDYFKTGLTGGTSGMLDQVDGNGLTGNERAVVVVGNNPARVYFYVLDVDNAGAEDSPYIIAPDTNAGDKRWILAARIPRTWKGAGSPTTTDDYNDGVRNGDWWLYGGNAWICTTETAGAAVWRLVPQLGTGSTNAAAGNHDHSTSNIASTAVSDWAEAVQDTAGAMWTSNTETGLSVTYDDSSGKLNASVTYGTDANTACQGNDSRLSNTRTPVAHNFIDTTGHPVTGLTTGNVVTATGETTYGFGDVGSIVYAATAKNTPVDADCLALSDSEASPTAGILKKITWSYVKSVLKTYFDGLYSASGHNHSATYSTLDHDATHITGASDEVDGDKLDVDWEPSNYTPTLVTNYADSVDNLTAHLKGIDTVLGSSAKGGIKVISFTQATSSPATILDPPNSSVITKIVIVVDTAASGGSPTLSVGTAGDTDRDMDELDCDVKVAGTYIVEPYTACGTDGDNIILTITPDSQTFAGRCYLHYAIPV